MRVQGARRLRLTFDRLPKAVGVTVLTQAATKGAIPIRDAARQNAPRGRTGNLRREIVERVLETSPTSVEVGVSWRRGKASRTSAFYGLFVHEGTRQRSRKGGGATGRMRPNPFLQRAFDTHKDTADRETKRVFLAALRRAARG